ncbi:MAG: redox-regulated ATPase YchF [bacterium]
MGFSLGIIGLPNVGKSTLFNILSKNKANVSNYPFCTIEPNVGIVEVPDERLANVQAFAKSPKAIPTVIEFKDIAGLVKGAAKGEGLGNKFLSHIRDVDAIAHVVRCFPGEEVTHVSGKIDPKADIEIINAELCLSDLSLVAKKQGEISAKAKSGDKKYQLAAEVFKRLHDALGEGRPAREVPIADNEQEYVKDLPLLTVKPVLYIANVDETGNGEKIEEIKGIMGIEGKDVIIICAKLEAELAELSPEDAAEMAQALSCGGMNLLESAGGDWGLGKLIRAGYQLLELITFFTANNKECRAWTVRKGTKVPQAAGKVHSDMEKGFIAADVIHYNDLLNCDSSGQARDKGVLHTEGKAYEVVDGDLILVKFNV